MQVIDVSSKAKLKACLLYYDSLAEYAKKNKISVSTVRRWLSDNPDFMIVLVVHIRGQRRKTLTMIPRGYEYTGRGDPGNPLFHDSEFQRQMIARRWDKEKHL